MVTRVSSFYGSCSCERTADLPLCHACGAKGDYKSRREHGYGRFRKERVQTEVCGRRQFGFIVEAGEGLGTPYRIHPWSQGKILAYSHYIVCFHIQRSQRIVEAVNVHMFLLHMQCGQAGWAFQVELLAGSDGRHSDIAFVMEWKKIRVC